MPKCRIWIFKFLLQRKKIVPIYIFVNYLKEREQPSLKFVFYLFIFFRLDYCLNSKEHLFLKKKKKNEQQKKRMLRSWNKDVKSAPLGAEISGCARDGETLYLCAPRAAALR